ncbi:hypothetical protein R1flu_016134 [Riccia fluitans]|uniref:Uncharacterized protein n=1 Tax=Riccia fluitans TaxID=41844 RepID=A0ABD1YLH0_9MARC
MRGRSSVRQEPGSDRYYGDQIRSIISPPFARLSVSRLHICRGVSGVRSDKLGSNGHYDVDLRSTEWPGRLTAMSALVLPTAVPPARGGGGGGRGGGERGSLGGSGSAVANDLLWSSGRHQVLDSGSPGFSVTAFLVGPGVGEFPSGDCSRSAHSRRLQRLGLSMDDGVRAILPLLLVERTHSRR